MKKILIPVDFSESSEKALDYAMNLSDRYNADVQILHVLNNNPKNGNSNSNAQEQTLQLEPKQYLEKLVHQYGNNPRLKYVFANGSINKEIRKQARKENVDLIIMGTEGISNYSKSWKGSNAFRVSFRSSCPVVTIRNGFRSKEIKRIVLPITALRTTRQKIPFTTKLAASLGAEIHVVDVRSTQRTDIINKVEAYAMQAKKYIESKNVKVVRKSEFGSSIMDITLAYAVHVEADMISVVSNSGISSLGFSSGNFAQQLVSYSPIPVLSIHPRF